MKTLNTHINKKHPNNNFNEKDHNDPMLLEFLNNFNIEDSILSDSVIENDFATNNDIYSFKNHVTNSYNHKY